MSGTGRKAEKLIDYLALGTLCDPPLRPAGHKRRPELDALLRIFEPGAGGPAFFERGLHDVLLFADPGRGL